MADTDSNDQPPFSALTFQGESTRLIQQWRERASRYVRGESASSEFGRCEAYANCADQLEALLTLGPQPIHDYSPNTKGDTCDCADCGRVK